MGCDAGRDTAQLTHMAIERQLQQLSTAVATFNFSRRLADMDSSKRNDICVTCVWPEVQYYYTLCLVYDHLATNKGGIPGCGMVQHES